MSSSSETTAHLAMTKFLSVADARFGADWRENCRPMIVAELADETVRGFGGQALSPVHHGAGGTFPTIWRFEDGSQVRTGGFGVAEEKAQNAA